MEDFSRPSGTHHYFAGYNILLNLLEGKIYITKG